MFLRLALARMRLKRSKIENSIIQQRHRAAQALREGNDDQARLLVEEMFRAQHRTQALVQLLLLGEHLLTRIDAIELSPYFFSRSLSVTPRTLCNFFSSSVHIFAKVVATMHVRLTSRGTTSLNPLQGNTT